MDEPNSDVGVASAVAREQTEISSVVEQAALRPRSEAEAFVKLTRACSRFAFADGASYRFPRGGSQVTGPSVKLAREMARCWGNLRYGYRHVRHNPDSVHIKGFAHDCESNTYIEYEDTFAKLVQRRKKDARGTVIKDKSGKAVTEWVEPDERDLRELINRRGAMCVRQAILHLLPYDQIDEALSLCDATLRSGELGPDRETSIRSMVRAFDKYAVTTEMLEHNLGHELNVTTIEELADLRQIFTSIKDGHTKREDHFIISQRPGSLVDQMRQGSAEDGKGAASGDDPKTAKRKPKAPAKPKNGDDEPAHGEASAEEIAELHALVTKGGSEEMLVIAKGVACESVEELLSLQSAQLVRTAIKRIKALSKESGDGV